MAIEILGPVRHECHRTGGCCEGHMVRVSAEDEARIAVVAPGLSVEDPVVDLDGNSGRSPTASTNFRVLRREGGRCVFLNADGCRIHAAHGAEAKPAICRQYPLVATRVGANVRVGVDSGCLSGWASWESGPKLDSPELSVSAVPNEPEWLVAEDTILEAARTLPVGALIERVTGQDMATFAEAVKRRARRGKLEERIRQTDNAPQLRAALADLVVDGPVEALSSAVDAYVREMVRRVVWLRLVHPTVHPEAGARLVLAGAVLLSPIREISRFGPAFAAWTRVVRSPEIAQILLARE